VTMQVIWISLAEDGTRYMAFVLVVINLRVLLPVRVTSNIYLTASVKM
jgi:hypothetical protein